MFSDPPPDARTPDVHQPLTDTEDTNTAAIVVPIVVVFVIVVITAVVLYWRRWAITIIYFEINKNILGCYLTPVQDPNADWE